MVPTKISISEQTRAQVAQLLGRQPRGLKEVVVSNAQGQPAVIRVASLVDEKPFPTLYWLIDPALNYRIDQEEAGGLIASLQRHIDSSPALQESMGQDHRKHMATREGYLSSVDREAISRLGFDAVFKTRGIGGIADFTRIRCLHTWYAAHLVQANTIGKLLDKHWQSEPELSDRAAPIY